MKWRLTKDIVSTLLVIVSSIICGLSLTNLIEDNWYPYITCAHNIGHESLIGKIVLDGFDHLDIDPTNKIYDGGKMFIEALLSKDYNFIGNTYFNLPKAEDIIKVLEKEN